MKSILNLLILVICIFLGSELFAQTEDIYSRGSFELHASSALERLIEKKHIYDRFNSSYSGYRVQVYFAAGNNSKQGAFDTAQELQDMGIEAPIYITYNSPYYRVRVGNYKIKLDAEAMKVVLDKYFNGCFVVKEEIKVTDIEYKEMKELQQEDNKDDNNADY